MVLRAERYGRLFDDLAHVSVRCEAGVARIEVGRIGGYPTPPAGTECLFAVGLSAARSLWPRARPIAVELAHPLRADPEKLKRFVSFVNAPDVPDPTITFVDERGQIRPARAGENGELRIVAGPTLKVGAV